MVEELINLPTFANIDEGGLTENFSAEDLAELAFCAVAYPWTLVAAKLKSIREALEGLKKPLPQIVSYKDVCEGVGSTKYCARGDDFREGECG